MRAYVRMSTRPPSPPSPVFHDVPSCSGPFPPWLGVGALGGLAHVIAATADQRRHPTDGPANVRFALNCTPPPPPPAASQASGSALTMSFLKKKARISACFFGAGPCAVSSKRSLLSAQISAFMKSASCLTACGVALQRAEDCADFTGGTLSDCRVGGGGGGEGVSNRRGTGVRASPNVWGLQKIPHPLQEIRLGAKDLQTQEESTPPQPTAHTPDLSSTAPPSTILNAPSQISTIIHNPPHPEFPL